jgi:hypothetical protein
LKHKWRHRRCSTFEPKSPLFCSTFEPCPRTKMLAETSSEVKGAILAHYQHGLSYCRISDKLKDLEMSALKSIVVKIIHEFLLVREAIAKLPKAAKTGISYKDSTTIRFISHNCKSNSNFLSTKFSIHSSKRPFLDFLTLSRRQSF